MTRRFRRVFGVDFSGGQSAGANTWIAELQPVDERLRLLSLRPLADLAGKAVDRDAALSALVDCVRQSQNALWAMDFPFGLPVELSAMGSTWTDQLGFVAHWTGGAVDFGRWCVAEALQLGRSMHIRRLTDTQTKTPFDCYHYRIIYQTFHGMRDVLRPLDRVPGTAVLPFRYARLKRARRVIVETCPSSTLKRLGLPHQKYKSPTSRVVPAEKRAVRRMILSGLEPLLGFDKAQRAGMLANPGGDALDAVLAGVGAWQRFRSVDHQSIRRHRRYPREGFVF